jgi:hypothetical protein
LGDSEESGEAAGEFLGLAIFVRKDWLYFHYSDTGRTCADTHSTVILSAGTRFILWSRNKAAAKATLFIPQHS